MVNWDQFRVCNSNPRIDFENLCRMLFRHLYLSPGTELMMAPNNPGVEVEPVWDRNNEKRISYQSKFLTTPRIINRFFILLRKRLSIMRARLIAYICIVTRNSHRQLKRM